tara:strand:- start:322 stop:642 length:321 start_codon:yes stop_codon:yes gene_type:complete
MNFASYNEIQLSNSQSRESRGDIDDYESYYAVLTGYNDDDPNPLDVDRDTIKIIKHGKCKKCGFGNNGVAKTMYQYEYDIMNVKRFMTTKINWLVSGYDIKEMGSQ